MEEGGHPSEKRMDDFFMSLGLKRKKIAKDGSCLFRAVAEQVLLCQSRHTEVRARCVEFLKDNRELYEAFIEGDFEDYVFKIQDPKHWVGEVEMNALAIIYKRDFLIFQEPGKAAVNITANGFKDQIQLCFLNGNHYDCVYPISHIQNTAFCQSLLYELLYERVFKEDRSVLGMGQRGGRRSELTDDHMAACPSSDESETEDPIWIQDEASKQGGQQNRGRGRGRGRGLSERLRRSLNPNLLRNVDYDVWLSSKRVQQKKDFCMAAGLQYSVGDPCQVSLEEGGRSYRGSIRKVSPSNGPVTVYVEEQGREVSVPLLKLCPVSETSWKSVVTGEKRTNGQAQAPEWVEPKGRGKLLPSSAPPSASKAIQRGSTGHMQKQRSWPPQTTGDAQRDSRGRSASIGENSRKNEDEEEEMEELKAALVEIELRDEQNFPALAAVARDDRGKRGGGRGRPSQLKRGASAGQVDAPIPDDVTSTSPSSSPPTHPELPKPPPTTWLANKAPLPNQSTTFNSTPRSPWTAAAAVAPPTATAEPRSPSPLLLPTTSPCSSPIFISPVAPFPAGAQFYSPHTSPAPSSRSSPALSPASTDPPAPDVMHTARHMQLPAAYVSNTPVPQNIVPNNPVPQTSLSEDPTLNPSVPQNPLLQSYVPQSLAPSTPLPQHLGTQRAPPQHLQPSELQNSLPSVPQQSGSHPTLPQSCVPPSPLHQNPLSENPVPQPSVAQYPVPQPSVAQYPVPQPSVPQPSVPQPSVAQYPVPQPSVAQYPVPQPSVAQYPVPQPSVAQYPVPQPSVPQPSVAQYPVPQPSVAQYPVPQPSVAQYPAPQYSLPQHSVPEYLQFQASSPVSGLSPPGSQASAGSPPTPFSHIQASPLPPDHPLLPPQHTFTPPSQPEPGHGTVPLQQLSQLHQDLLYPGFPTGCMGDALATPAYSYSKTGDDLPPDLDRIRWFFNLGVKAYNHPMLPPFIYLAPLRQAHSMLPPPQSPSRHPDPSPSPQGVHPSPPPPQQRAAPLQPGHPSGYPSLGHRPQFPGALSPGLQLYPSDQHLPSPGRPPGPGLHHLELESYSATGANAASGSMMANVGMGVPAAGGPADQGLSRSVLLIDPLNTPIWISEPKFQDSIGAGTSAAHGHCPSPTSNSGHHNYRPYHGSMINPADPYVHMRVGPGLGAGMETWNGPEPGSSNRRGRRGNQHQRRGRGYRRSYARGVVPNHSHYNPAPRTDQGYY